MKETPSERLERMRDHLPSVSDMDDYTWLLRVVGAVIELKDAQWAGPAMRVEDAERALDAALADEARTA